MKGGNNLEKDYENNAYYKCLLNALMDAFAANRIDLNPSSNCYDSETTWNSNYYTYLAALDFCENLTMYGDDYPNFNLEECFSEIREPLLRRIQAGKRLINATQI
jgi:hypothetical protein